jgi:transcriptional regulator with XRE-family HTH domain
MIDTDVLKRLRTARKWSRAELGRRARVHASDVSRIEAGRARPYPGQLQRLAKALGTTAEALTVSEVSAPAA